MKLRLLILLAAALAAAPAAGQTIKSLGYNTTNGQIVYSGSNSLTFTNALQFSTNARAATRTNLGGTTVGNSVFTATNAAAAATAIGLGNLDNVSIGDDGGSITTDDFNANNVNVSTAVTFTTNEAAATTRTNLGLGATNNVTFSNITANGIINAKSAISATPTNATNTRGIQWSNLNTEHAAIYGTYDGVAKIGLSVGTSNSLSDVASFRSTGMTVSSNAVVGGTLAVSNTATFSTNVTVSGNATLNGAGNLAPQQTADSASSLMTRGLSDDRYLGEFWHAWRMSAYNTTNIPVAVFKTAPCVLYTNGQSAFYVEAFLDPSKYAGKTVRVLAYCRVDSTNGGNVQGVGQIKYLTNNAGGSDPNFPITVGGQAHGTIGVYTNVNTDVFPVATSTNQYLIFTSNVGTISNNATMIIATFGFNRATNISTFTNNLYMQGVQVVVE